MTASAAADQVPELTLKQLRELRKSEDLLYVRNNTPNLITCNRDREHPFHIEPAGQSGSIQILPKEVLDLPRFQKLWMKKAVTVSNDEGMEQQIHLLMGGELKLSQERMDELMGKVDSSNTTKSLEERRCLVCDGRVYMSEASLRDGALPLCELHESDSRHFIAEAQPDGGYAYSRVTIDRTPSVTSTVVPSPKA
jgi:hypothetical protein